MPRVLAPFLGGCDHRQRAWDFLKPRYPWPVTEAIGSSPWSKGAALQPAIERCEDDILIVADADVWCDELAEAVEEVEKGAPWAIPHSHVFRLTEQATENVLAGEPLEGQETEQKPYLGLPGGGYVIAHRDVLLSVPMDSRFVGWGQEDQSWAAALGTLVGSPWRGSAPLFHLWHPPQERRSRVVGSDDGWRLRRRYMKARRDPVQMRNLVEEGRLALTDSQPPLHDHAPARVG